MEEIAAADDKKERVLFLKLVSMMSKIYFFIKKIPVGFCFTLLIFGAVVCSSCEKEISFHEDPGSPQLPGETDTLPSGADENVFNISDFGATGDGKTLNTEAIQRTIDSAKIQGGTVIVPKGNFLCGPLTLYSNINLHLEEGAVLKLDNDIASFPVDDNKYLNFIDASEASNIKITGKGIIDGQGKVWWEAYDAGKLGPRRPQLIYMDRCSHIEISGIQTLDPPNTHFSLKQCKNVVFNNVTITAPENSHNTDGINISGQDILIENCTIQTGDDNIAFNVGNPPVSQNIMVKNCTFGYGHGLSIGSYTKGGLEGLTVDSCTFDGTTSGIRMKSNRDRGGLVKDLSYSNITMTNVRYPVYMTSYYPHTPDAPEQDAAKPVVETTPVWKDISMSNITISDCSNSVIIWGLPEMSVDNVKFTNIDIAADHGMKIYFAKKIQFEDAEIDIKEGDKVSLYKADIKGL